MRPHVYRASIGPSGCAAEDVDVEVRHFLAAALADVGEQPIALGDQPGIARDLADGADEAGDLRVRRLARRNRPSDT